MRRVLFFRRAALAVAVWCCTPAPAVPQTAPERIHVNDNRTPSGRRDGTTLSVALEARAGQWFPDGEGLPGVTVHAFAADEGPLQVPGPIIRVALNTTIKATVRNRLSEALTVHGLHSRSGKPANDAVVIPPGEVRELAFAADKVGTYFYWASTDPAAPIERLRPVDTQLSGAFVVDAPGTAAADRVLVIGNWFDRDPNPTPDQRFRFVINGRSWPATERMSFKVGDIVRMRVINLGAGVHPMHLHGFYFHVDSRGDQFHDEIYPPGASPRLVVTERLTPGRTFSLTWRPTRPGNWLFHCHDNVHLDHGGPVDGGPRVARAPQHAEGHLHNMAGPVIGITVTGQSLEAAESSRARRQLRLVARVDEGGTNEEPAYGYTLHDARSTEPPPRPYLPGPTLVLKRGEPVSIVVENQLKEPTAVHWHGIELESYYDGVAGFAGEGARVAPAIPPAGTFEARFTPPRSGTFMYHTHLDDTRQQRAGLTGALIVVDDPATYDPETDITLLVTVPRKVADIGVVLVNGTAQPPLRTLRVGQSYRLRFINLHIFRPSMRMRLMRGDSLVVWRALAKDGMDLPRDRAIESDAEVQMGNGETYDFEFVPTTPGDMRLDITQGNLVLLTSMPIRVE